MSRGTGRATGRRPVAAAGAGLLAAVLALSGCSQAGSSSSKGSAAGSYAVAQAPAQRQAAAAGGSADSSGSGSSSGSSSGTAAATALPAGRSLIYTGEMQLRATGVDAAVTRAEQLATAAGGYVDSEQSGPVDELPLTAAQSGYQQGGGATGGADGSDTSVPLQTLPEPGDIGPQGAQLVLRIPTAGYATAFQRLLGLGSVLGQEHSAQDVTAQVVDVASRVKSQQASVDRVRALMDRAQSITDVISLEAALTQRESDLESLEAQQQALQSQTAMSTVTVQVFEKPVAVAATPARPGRNVGSAALRALADGWHGLYLTFRVLLVALSAALPFALVLLPLGWLLLRLARRRGVVPAAAAAARVDALPGPPEE